MQNQNGERLSFTPRTTIALLVALCTIGGFSISVLQLAQKIYDAQVQSAVEAEIHHQDTIRHDNLLADLQTQMIEMTRRMATAEDRLNVIAEALARQQGLSLPGDAMPKHHR